jgi:hypothetical protein
MWVVSLSVVVVPWISPNTNNLITTVGFALTAVALAAMIAIVIVDAGFRREYIRRYMKSGTPIGILFLLLGNSLVPETGARVEVYRVLLVVSPTITSTILVVKLDIDEKVRLNRS